MATGTGLRGPLKYQSTGGVPSPLASPSVVGTPQPFLSGAPLEAVDLLPVLSTNMPDETPRTFGYSWAACGAGAPPEIEADAGVNGLGIFSPTGTAATATGQDILGGAQRLTPQAATDNAQGYISSIGAAFAVVAGKRIFFECRLAIPIASQSQGEIFAGLSATTLATDLATPPTDGIFFLKADAGTDFTFSVRGGSASTSITTVFAKAGVTLPAQNVPFSLGFLVDAGGTGVGLTQGAVSCYVNGRLAGSIASTDANLATLATTPTLLKLAIGRQNSGANTDTLDVFQCICVEER